MMQLYKYLVPIGVLFAVMLYGSNKAYLYCSVAFLQFMKETNVVLAFLFSALAGLQTINRQRLFVILWVISGSSLCVSGELHFVLTGFLLQLVSQFAEGIRAVIAELVLSGNDYKLDSLSRDAVRVQQGVHVLQRGYAFLVSPVCLVGLVIGNIVT